MRSISCSACFISSMDCFLIKAPQPVVMPVLTHLRVQKILIDGEQLFLERQIERSDDFRIAFHMGEL